MTNVQTLTGVYNFQGSSFTHPGFDFKLILSVRKHPTEKQPEKFLIAKPMRGKTFTDGTSYIYVSSLYPDPVPDQYHFDFQGVPYTLAITGNSAEIQRGGKLL